MLPISHYLPYIFTIKVGRMYILNFGVEGLRFGYFFNMGKRKDSFQK